MAQIPGSYSSGDGTTNADSNTGIADRAQERVGEVVGQAQGAAGQIAEQAKQQATSQLESQKSRAVESLVTVAQALRQTGQHLQEQDQAGVAGYVEGTAERVETVTNYLRSREVSELVADTQDFARRQPGLFVTGAVALGFLGARFLMSSGKRAAAQRGSGMGSSSGQMAGGGGSVDAPPPGDYGAGLVGSGYPTTGTPDLTASAGVPGVSGGLAS